MAELEFCGLGDWRGAAYWSQLPSEKLKAFEVECGLEKEDFLAFYFAYRQGVFELRQVLELSGLSYVQWNKLIAVRTVRAHRAKEREGL